MARETARASRTARHRRGGRAPAGVVDPLEAHRQRAIAAMLDVAGERGYAATTVGHVLERAGMSRRTFYSVFRNREDCFLAAYDEAGRQALARVARVRSEPPAPARPELLELALTDLLTIAAARPALARVLLVEPASAGRPGIERHERTMREFARRLADAVEEPQPATSRRPALRFEAGVGAVERVVHARVVEGRTDELPRLAPELANVLRGLAGEDAKAAG
jgi:AcrR family transcriptional regulator